MLTALATLIGFALGAGVVAAALLVRSSSRVRVAEREAETIRREAQIESRELAVKLRADVESEVQHRRTDVAARSKRRSRRQSSTLERKATEIERREQGLADRGPPRQAAAGGPEGGKGPGAGGPGEGGRPDRRRGETFTCSSACATDPARVGPKRSPAGGRRPGTKPDEGLARSSRTHSSASLQVTRPRPPSPSSRFRRTT